MNSTADTSSWLWAASVLSFFAAVGGIVVLRGLWLLSSLSSKLAWSFPDMRNLEQYFRNVNLLGSGEGHHWQWPSWIYSLETLQKIESSQPYANANFDEWQHVLL